MEQITIKTFSIFSSNDVVYLYLIDEKGNHWVYLKPIFKTSQKCNSLLKKHPDFRFQRKRDFESFSLPKFSRIPATALFLHLEDFEKIAALNKKLDVFTLFTKQITNPVSKETVLTQDLLPSETVPRKAFVYLAHFPTLNLGKVGITQNIRNRKSTLKQEFCKQARIVFEETSNDAPKVEKKMLAWLGTKNALVSQIPGKKTLNKEVFDLGTVSLEQAQKVLENYLLEEKTHFSAWLNIDQILIEKMQNDNDFALKIYETKLNYLMRAIDQSFSPEEKKVLIQKLTLQQLQLVPEKPLLSDSP